MSQITLTAGDRRTKSPKGERRAGTRRATDQAFLDHYFKRLDPEVADSFSEQQKHAIWTLFGARGIAKHAIELRRTLPLPGGRRFYLVFLCGREQRGITRLHGQGERARGVALLWYLGLGAVTAADVSNDTVIVPGWWGWKTATGVFRAERGCRRSWGDGGRVAMSCEGS